MRHLSIVHSVVGFVCCTSLASPVWAQGGAAPSILEPAPTTGSAPAAAAPEPGSALAALLSPPTPLGVTAAVAVAEDHSPERSGFVLGASLGLNLAVDATTGVQPNLQPGIGIGFKVDRAVITVGAEFSNLRSSIVTAARNGDKTSVTQTASTFYVVPGAQIGLVRSRDGRVELLGAIRFGLGAPTNDTTLNPAPNPTPTPSSLSTSRFSFMYELAPGVRYWAHKNFALNLLAGFRGDYLFLTTSGSFPKDTSITSVTSANTTGTNGIFASIGGIGVF